MSGLHCKHDTTSGRKKKRNREEGREGGGSARRMFAMPFVWFYFLAWRIWIGRFGFEYSDVPTSLYFLDKTVRTAFTSSITITNGTGETPNR